MLKIYLITETVKINNKVMEKTTEVMETTEWYNNQMKKFEKDGNTFKETNLYNGLETLKNCSWGFCNNVHLSYTFFKERPYLWFSPYINVDYYFKAYKDKNKSVNFSWTIEIKEYKHWSISEIIKNYNGDKAIRFLVERGLTVIQKKD